CPSTVRNIERVGHVVPGVRERKNCIRPAACLYGLLNRLQGDVVMLKALLTGTLAAVVVSAAAAAELPMDGGVVLNSSIASLTDGSDSGSVAQVKPGEELTITGACVANAKSAGDLRVMLTLSDADAKG